MPKRRLRLLETIQLTVAAELLVALAALSIQNWAVLTRYQEHTARTEAVMGDLQSFLSLMKDTETGQRGFLLTGDAAYLEPYRRATETIPQTLRKLEGELGTSTASQLRMKVKAKLDELALTVRLWQQGDPEAAVRVVKTNQGRNQMQAIRELVERETEAQAKTLGGQEQEEQRQAKQLSIVAIGGSVLLFIFLVLSSLNIGRQTAKREYIIGELKRSRAQKEEARKTFEATLSSIGDGVITTDMETRVIFMNVVAEAMTGWSVTEAKGKPLSEIFRIVNESTRQTVENPVDKVRRYGNVVGLANHTCLIRKDQTEVAIDDSGAPIRTRDGAMIGTVLVFRDIGERRATEKALERSERRYRQLANSMPQIVWTAQRDGTVDYCNERGREFFGVDGDERTHIDLKSWIHEADVERFEAEWKAALAQEREVDFECQMKQAYTGKYCWFLGRVTPMTDPASNALQWIGTFTDIDSRKKVEADLRRANEDLSQFAFSASHDLQEPLRNVIIFTQLFARRQRGKLDAESEEMVRLVVESAQRMEALIADLLLYVRTASVSSEKPPIVDANTALKKALSNLQAAIMSAGATIRSEGLPEVQMEEVHLQQLFQNLISNSLKYRSDQPPIISVVARRQREGTVFSVEDNGIGIDPQYKRQVFGLFKRLHGQSEYSGTGIGLAICQKIVDRYGGRIWVESEIGRGATFSFVLPAGGVVA